MLYVGYMFLFVLTKNTENCTFDDQHGTFMYTIHILLTMQLKIDLVYSLPQRTDVW